MQTCKHCKQEFDLVGRVFSNHVRWCDKNPKSYGEALSSAKRKTDEEKLGHVTPFSVICALCDTPFEVLERSKQFPKKEKYFCSRKCANTRVHSKETKQKLSDAAIESWKRPEFANIHINRLIKTNALVLKQKD